MAHGSLHSQMDGGRFERIFNYETPISRAVDSLRHLTITCTTKTKRHRIYAAQYGELMRDLLLRCIYLRRMIIHNIDPEDGGGSGR